MRKANIAISIGVTEHSNIWANGLNMNLAFLAQLFRASPIVDKVWLVQDNAPEKMPESLAFAGLEGIRDELAAATGRPVTFGWGPRFLHSTGQFHKGGPAEGVFLQITADSSTDVVIPERPFTFGQLISAQAAGDAQVLADHGVPVLRLHLTDRAAGVRQLLDIVNNLGR